MKDLNDATIHHLLTSEQLSNQPRRRRWSYSRHAVRDEDMHTRPVNHTMQHYTRQRMIDMYRRKRQQNGNGTSPRKNVSFAVQTNGSTVRLRDEALYDVLDAVPIVERRTGAAADDGIVFSAGPDRTGLPDSDHITETESVLPWLRDDEVLVCQRPLKWHNTSAPAWISNAEYTHYASPPESLTVPDPSGVAAQFELEEPPHLRRSSLTSSLRHGLSSLRSSLRRHLGGGGGGEPTVDDTSAICEEPEPPTAPPDEPVANHADVKPGSLDDPEAAEEGRRNFTAAEEGRRNFTAVSIEQEQEEKERTRL